MKFLKHSSPPLERSVLSHDKAIKWARTKVCVYADSVLCVGQMKDSPEAIERWIVKLKDSSCILSTKKQWESMGKAIEVEWTYFPGFSSLSILQEIQKKTWRENIQPEEFKDWIIFMSMFNDNDWNKNDEKCFSNAEKPKNYAMRFSQGHLTFLGPGSEEKWYGSSSYAQKGQ